MMLLLFHKNLKRAIRYPFPTFLPLSKHTPKGYIIFIKYTLPTPLENSNPLTFLPFTSLTMNKITHILLVRLLLTAVQSRNRCPCLERSYCCNDVSRVIDRHLKSTSLLFVLVLLYHHHLVSFRLVSSSPLSSTRVLE